MKFRLRSSAKLNLSLDILNRLPNGYHELSSVVHTVGLWDELDAEFEPLGSTIQLDCDRPDLGGPDNLVLKAVQMWREETGEQFGARLRLRKIIPSGAGMGGGSGNAAAALHLLNLRSPNPMSTARLSELGSRLGADVPLFLQGGAVLMEGVGERISPLPAIVGWVVVVKPAASLSTPAVYRAWDEGGFTSGLGTARLLECWPPAPETLATVLSNDLERAAEVAQPSAFDASPWRGRLLAAGALASQMTGSGTACFGIFANQAAALSGRRRLDIQLANELHIGTVQTFLAPLSERGIEVLGKG